MERKDEWSWPKRGVPFAELMGRLEKVEKENIDYSGKNKPILGFPGTTPRSEALRVHRIFAKRHPNNIGCHTAINKAERGFPGTQQLEREFVYGLAHLLGASDPEKQIDGYICFGGTDANDHALWLGRNKLWEEQSVSPGRKRGVVVLTSFLTHYSITKHFNRLLGGEAVDADSWDSNVLQEMPTDPRGELDPEALERKIREFYHNGYRRFIVVLSAGTINMGSIDPVDKICRMLEALKYEMCNLGNKEGIGIYVHVDAAFGGYVIPFLDPSCRFGFHNDMVDSMSVDPHKMGYLPYSAGVFLCRKGHLEYTKTEAAYLGGHTCYTVSGSRSGAIAVACWTMMQVLGWDGYHKILQRCMKNLDYLRCRLEEFNADGKKRVEFYSSRMNIQTVWLDKGLQRAMREEDDSGESLCDKYCIPPSEFPWNLTYPEWDGNMVKRKGQKLVFRFVAMPHLSRKKIDKFIDELREKYSSRSKK